MGNNITVGPINAEHADFSGLVRIEYRGQFVLTTNQLAIFYGCEVYQIKQNFNNNAARFEEGNHYFKLTGDDLKVFKMYIENFGLPNNKVENFYPPMNKVENFYPPMNKVENFYPPMNKVENFYSVGKNANVLYLWTKRGAARHCKMLGTDQAWEIFELLEESYFNAAPNDNSDVADSGDNNNPAMAHEFKELAAMAKDPQLKDKLIRQAATILSGKDFFTIDKERPKNFIEKFIDLHCERDPKASIKRGEFINKLRIECATETSMLTDRNLTAAVLSVSGIDYRGTRGSARKFGGIRWRI